MRNLRIFLNKLDVNILPSERKVREVKAPMISHVNEDAVESGYIGLKKSKLNEDVTQYAYLRVKDLKVFIEEIIKRDISGFSNARELGDKWWILFSGDKGGSYMKYHREIVNSFKAGSVDNVHIYCMFEATDSVENMQKVWLPYQEQILRMYQEEYTICGKKCKCSLEVIITFWMTTWVTKDHLPHTHHAPAKYCCPTFKIMETDRIHL